MSNQPNPAARSLRVLDESPGASNDASSRPVPPGVRLGNGEELFREWIPGPAGQLWRVWAAITVILLGAGIAGTLAGGWVAFCSALFTLFCGAVLITIVNFRGLQVVVDRHGIAWSFGLFRRRYRHDEVTMFRERVFGFRRGGVGGWGIGRGQDGMDVYEVWGANGTALDIVVQRGSVTRHYLVSTTAPDRLAAALVRATQNPSSATG